MRNTRGAPIDGAGIGRHTVCASSDDPGIQPELHRRIGRERCPSLDGAQPWRQSDDDAVGREWLHAHAGQLHPVGWLGGGPLRPAASLSHWARRICGRVSGVRPGAFGRMAGRSPSGARRRRGAVDAVEPGDSRLGVHRRGAWTSDRHMGSGWRDHDRTRASARRLAGRQRRLARDLLHQSASRCDSAVAWNKAAQRSTG